MACVGNGFVLDGSVEVLVEGVREAERPRPRPEEPLPRPRPRMKGRETAANSKDSSVVSMGSTVVLGLASGDGVDRAATDLAAAAGRKTLE